ncbi:purine-nucleoside phosphorylase [Parelusimicrobium proximum]|uniref:purine-nucleoside phosphorylase n=1 Tax=Parelusimicrobium proximum TaxID=3228953 RepID=UPI003D171622
MSQLLQVKKAAAFINKKTKNFKPEIALITGSGLAGSVPPLKNEVKIPYKSIPGFLKSTVQGHSGNLIFGEYKKKKIMVMQGRFHYYEGHSIKDIALAVRVMKALGVDKLIVSAAVGSLNPRLTPGSLAILKDHINFMGTNPLIGNYDPAFGPMFTEMGTAYNAKMKAIALKTAKKLKINHAEAVYIAVTGPSFETPAEIRAFKTLGADVVGMSTVPEVIAARQLGIEVCGLSWSTNLASGMSKVPLSHEETLSETKKIEGKFKKFLEEFIPAV